jgi:hypothetical protein
MNKTTKTLRVLAEIKTYNPQDVTDTGYDVQLRGDGSVRLVHRSRWAGSRDGDTYVSPPEYVETSGTDYEDYEGALTARVHEILLAVEAGEMRQTRLGWIVR